MTRLLLGATVALAVALVPTAANAAGPSYANCTALQKTYGHGIGRTNAHDVVRGSTKPVTTWRHDTAGYNKAVKANRDLDRDRDGVACEKR